MLKSKVRQTKQSAHPLSWGGASFSYWSSPHPLSSPRPLVPPSPIGPAATHSSQPLNTCHPLSTLCDGNQDCSGAGSCGPGRCFLEQLAGGGWRGPSIIRAGPSAAPDSGKPRLPCHSAPQALCSPRAPPLARLGPLPLPAPLRRAGAPSPRLRVLSVCTVKMLLLSRKLHAPPTPPALRLPPLALELLLEVPPGLWAAPRPGPMGRACPGPRPFPAPSTSSVEALPFPSPASSSHSYAQPASDSSALDGRPRISALFVLYPLHTPHLSSRSPSLFSTLGRKPTNTSALVLLSSSWGGGARSDRRKQ